LGEDSPDYVKEVLSPESLVRVGIFNPDSVSKLLSKMNSGKAYSEIDNMAITAIISTQLLYKQFIEEFKYLNDNELINYDIRSEANFN
jgi:asparagine synthase (glutamine-hydrolysing)